MTKWLLSGVLILVGAALLAVSGRTLWDRTGAFARTGVEESTLGVVDLQALVSNHPSWKKLAWLDGEIQKMEEKTALSDRVIQELGGTGGVKGRAGKLRDEALSGLMKIKSQRELMQRKLEKDAMQAASKLQALQARARQRELDELKQLRSLEEEKKRQLKAEFDARIEKDLKGSVLDLQGKIGQSMSQGSKDAQKELDAYAQSLAKLRDQEFAAKKEQVESKLTGVLDEERKKLDTDMQRAVQEALKANQQEKVNLQLKRMAATDKETIAAIEKELEVLYKEEQAKKDEKAKELSTAFEAIKKREVARSEQEMRAFQEELSKRYGARLEAKKAELMQRLRQKGPGSAEIPAIKKEFADRKQALVGRFESDFRKRQEMLAGEIQAEWARRQKKIREDFEKERETILKELYEKKGKMEGELRQTRDKTVEDLKKEGMKKGDKGGTGQETARDELEGLRQQREQLFLNILAEIKEKVARIAGEKKVKVVLGSYYSKGDCLDLTDWAMEAIKK